MELSALSWWDPWGTLVALEEKRYETRSWDTYYRGPLAVHVAKTWRSEQTYAFYREPFLSILQAAGYRSKKDLPLGYVIAVVDLVGIYLTEKIRPSLTETELSFGDYSNGRFAWQLENVRLLPEPIPAKGQQRLWLWTVPDHLVTVLGL